MKVLALCLVLTAAFVANVNAATNKVVCYYGTWAHYRLEDGKVSVQDLNPKLCTHLIYSFVGLTPDGDIRIFDSWLDIELKGFENFVNLKLQNPNLKVLVAIGGWNERAERFSAVSESASLRQAFARNAVNFVKKYGFDGFDLDWEYPANADQGGRPVDKANFIEMIKELRKAFDPEGLLLTAAVGATQGHRDSSYDVPSMSKFLDFINIMAYDLHGHWDKQTGQNAPLYAHPSDVNKNLNVDIIVKQWIKDGADPQKLILGLGLYGRSYTMASAGNNGVGVTTIGGGTAGPFTKEAGSLAYSEICLKLKNEGWTRVWDDAQKVPYAYKDNQWVGYDDIPSLDLKVDLAKKSNLGGVMVWSIEQDDVRNLCGTGSYPLLTAINKRLGGSVGPSPTSPTTSRPTQVPTQGPTTQAPTQKPTTSAPSGICTKPGYVRDPSNCGVFYLCDVSNNSYRYECAPGLYFDPSFSGCNFAASVEC